MNWLIVVGFLIVHVAPPAAALVSYSTMPYKSLKQEGWAHTPAGEKALGGPAKVKEWDSATKGKKLPKKAPTAKKGSK